MRVLVSTGIFPNRSDMTRGVYVFQQVAALARRVSLAVVAPIPFIPPLARSVRYRAFAGVPRGDVLDGVAVTYPRYVVVPRIGRFLHGFFVFLCTLGTHLRVARTLHPDVVLSFFAYPYGFAAVLVAGVLRRPVVVSCRGSDINHLARPFLRRRLIAWSLRRCHCVVVVSRALGDEVAALGVRRESIRVIPNGIDTARFQVGDRVAAREELGLPVGDPLVVCVSRLSHEKGIDLLVDAVAQAEMAGVIVVVVGDGPERAALEARGDRLGLGARVRFAGRQPHDAVPRWLAAADLVVLSSRSEGHPNAVVEALACGRPVVATGVGGVPDILTGDDLGIIVAPENAGALATGIRQALSRAWDPARLTSAAHARTWQRVADDLYDVLAAATGTGTAPANEGRVMAR
jgi:glycosyltransferase involved in cell wall biosynthesis